MLINMQSKNNKISYGDSFFKDFLRKENRKRRYIGKDLDIMLARAAWNSAIIIASEHLAPSGDRELVESLVASNMLAFPVAVVVKEKINKHSKS